MANAVTVLKRSMPMRGLTAMCRITLSGSYATPGEIIDFAAAVGFTNKVPDKVEIDGNSGWEFRYNPATLRMSIRGQQPTSATAGIIPLDELANGAYPGTLTGDTITATVYWLP